MKHCMILLGLCVALTACQTSEQPASKQQKLKASETKPEATDTPKQPDTKPVETTPSKALPNTGWQVKQQDTLWFIDGHNTRLCLPEGLYQHSGLVVTIDGSTIQPPKPNVRQSCLLFDATTIKLDPAPKTTQLFVETQKGIWVQKERYALGPAKTGVRIKKVCVPKGMTQLKARYTVEGYPLPVPKDRDARRMYERRKRICEPYVFTSIKTK